MDLPIFHTTNNILVDPEDAGIGIQVVLPGKCCRRQFSFAACVDFGFRQVLPYRYEGTMAAAVSQTSHELLVLHKMD